MDIQIFSSQQFDDPDTLSLSAGELHIWFFSLCDYDRMKTDFCCLSDEERLRAERLAHSLDQKLYFVAHTALRKLLGAYLHRAPESLTFSIGEHGKPFLPPSDCPACAVHSNLPLSDCPARTVHFNLSHSGEQIALAFCADSPIGIDIQKIDPDADTAGLRRRFFHPEEERFFSGLDAQTQTLLFYQFWTIREAFLKALGTGLTMSTSSFCIKPDTKKRMCKTHSLLNGAYEQILPAHEYYRIARAQADFSCWEICAVLAPDGYACSAAYQN